MDIKTLIKKGPSARPPKIMLIGVEGVGKSTAGAQMPAPVFICGENGLVGPQFEDVPNYTPEKWQDVLDFVDALAAEPSGYKSLVIDTLDWIEPMLYAHVVNSQNKPEYKTIADIPFGRGIPLAQNEARKLIVRLDKVNAAGMNVLILSHSQEQGDEKCGDQGSQKTQTDYTGRNQRFIDVWISVRHRAASLFIIRFKISVSDGGAKTFQYRSKC